MPRCRWQEEGRCFVCRGRRGTKSFATRTFVGHRKRSDGLLIRRSLVRVQQGEPEKTLVRKNKSFFQLYSPYGELYCFVVIFGLRPSDIASRVWGANIISLLPRQKYHYDARNNITLCEAQNITNNAPH